MQHYINYFLLFSIWLIYNWNSLIRSVILIGGYKLPVKFIDIVNVIIFVDNCYGEFIETVEPTEFGADIMAGSLMKNIGGGIAPGGGYIVAQGTPEEVAKNKDSFTGMYLKEILKKGK